jgi:nucleotide-binding universal stress UspA family protein
LGKVGTGVAGGTGDTASDSNLEDIMGPWKPVVVGVDTTPESARAARLGWNIAQRAGTECRLVHVVPDYTSEVFAVVLPPNFSAVQDALMRESRSSIETALRGTLPDDALRAIVLQAGRPAAVLARMAGDAQLLVLGGKHHTALGRWLVGSTAHQVVRATETPVLVAGPSAEALHRILAAVDLSSGAERTVQAAQRLAELFEAELRVLTVIEPLPPVITDFGLIAAQPVAIGADGWYRAARESFERTVWPLVQYSRAEPQVVHGTAEHEIRREVSDWRADLLVVGTHSKGPVERLLIGSVTHHLLNDLPASLLVVPVPVLVEAGAGTGRKSKSRVGSRSR